MNRPNFEFFGSFSGQVRSELSPSGQHPNLDSDGSVNSVTGLLQDLSNDEAAEAFWKLYFPRLVGYAEQKLKSVPGGVLDEEDIALSAIHSFFEAMETGKYQLKSREELWRLLATIAIRKVFRESRRALTEKRGGDIAHTDLISDVADKGKMPRFVHQVHAECKDLLKTLPDESLRVTAEMKLEGCSNAEISDLLCCTAHETKAKLKKIRQIWRRQLESQD